MTNVKKGILYTLILVIIVFVLMLGAVKALEPDVPEVNHWEEYRVKPGDTLWNIVPGMDGYDVRDMIDLVIEHNGIKSSGLIAYDIIELPVWEAE